MVSGKDVTKITVQRLLAMPKLQSGTAAIISDSCLTEIRSWGLKDRIVAMWFETTASNAGCKGGVCFKLETFVLQQLSTEYHRDDYKELLELTVHQKE